MHAQSGRQHRDHDSEHSRCDHSDRPQRGTRCRSGEQGACFGGDVPARELCSAAARDTAARDPSEHRHVLVPPELSPARAEGPPSDARSPPSLSYDAAVRGAHCADPAADHHVENSHRDDCDDSRSTVQRCAPMAQQAPACTVRGVEHSELPTSPWPAPSPQDAVDASARPRWSKSRAFGIALVIILALTGGPLIAAMSGKSGYAEVVPGPGIDIGAGITGEVRDSEFPRRTGFLGLTVGIKEVSMVRYWWLSLRGVELMQVEDDRGTVSAVMMDQSQTIAAIVASEFVTGKQTETAVLVQSVVPGSPADEAGITVGDVYRTGRVAGERTTQRFTEPLDVVEFVEAAGPGTSITLDVERDGETRTVTLTLNSEGKMGVMLSVVAPDIAIGVEVDGVGGSSAGLTMSLALIDALSEGDLTAGRNIAATGEIGVDGAVYPIGGVAQKLQSDTARNADLVFVPASQDDIPQGADVVRVGSVEQAVKELCKRGATDRVCDRTRL